MSEKLSSPEGEPTKELVIEALKNLPKERAFEILGRWQEQREKELNEQFASLGRLEYSIEFVEIYAAAGMPDDAADAADDARAVIENDSSVSDPDRLRLLKRLGDALNPEHKT